MNFLRWLQLLLIGLKLTGLLTCSWFIILLPIEIELLGLLGFIIAAYLIANRGR